MVKYKVKARKYSDRDYLSSSSWLSSAMSKMTTIAGSGLISKSNFPLSDCSNNFYNEDNKNCDSNNTSICSDDLQTDTKALLPKSSKESSSGKDNAIRKKFQRGKKPSIPLNKLSRALFRGGNGNGHHTTHGKQSHGKQNHLSSQSTASSTDCTQPETPQLSLASNEFDFNADFAKFVESSMGCVEAKEDKISSAEPAAACINSATFHDAPTVAATAPDIASENENDNKREDVSPASATETINYPGTPPAHDLRIRLLERMEELSNPVLMSKNALTHPICKVGKQSKIQAWKEQAKSSNNLLDGSSLLSANPSMTNIADGDNDKKDGIFNCEADNDENNNVNNRDQERKAHKRISIIINDNTNNEPSNTEGQKEGENNYQYIPKAIPGCQDIPKTMPGCQDMPKTMPGCQDFHASCTVQADEFMSMMAGGKGFSENLVAFEAGWGGFRTLLTDKLMGLEESLKVQCDNLATAAGLKEGDHKCNTVSGAAVAAATATAAAAASATANATAAFREPCAPRGYREDNSSANMPGVECKLEPCATSDILEKNNNLHLFSEEGGDEEFMKENRLNISLPKSGMQDDLKDVSSILGIPTDDEGIVANDILRTKPLLDPRKGKIQLSGSSESTNTVFFDTTEWFITPGAAGLAPDSGGIVWSPEMIRSARNMMKDIQRSEKNSSSPTSVMMEI